MKFGDLPQSLSSQLSKHQDLQMENLKKILSEKLHLSDDEIKHACKTGDLGSAFDKLSEAERIQLGFRMRDLQKAVLAGEEKAKERGFKLDKL